MAQKFCPNTPVIKWTKMHVNSPSVTPNCPTFVLKIPVLYYIQLEIQNDA